MLRRWVLVSLVLCLGMLASAELAAAGGLNGGLNGSGAPVTGLVWGGGNRVPPPPTGLIWQGVAPPPPPTGVIWQGLARPAFTIWEPIVYEPPVNRYDWSRWFGWIIRPD